MTEAVVSSELEQNQHRIFESLSSLGIIFPEAPLFTPDVISPRPWLVRGEGRLSRLTDDNDRFFVPQSGEMGTKGVFFGDCLQSLMYPQNGAYYVYSAPELSTEWIVSPSQRMDDAVNLVASELNLRPMTISGGLEAEQAVYDKNNIYQSKRGIATIASSVAVAKVRAILVTPSFILDHKTHMIPSSYKKKIVELPRL